MVYVYDHIGLHSVEFKIKIAEGMNDSFQRFFIAKGTVRRLPDGRILKAACSGCVSSWNI